MKHGAVKEGEKGGNKALLAALARARRWPRLGRGGATSECKRIW